VIISVRGDGSVRAAKEDGKREPLILRAERLLAVDELGRGRHYRFIAYRQGRRYRTHAYVAAVDGAQATLVVPEWHPLRPVHFPLRLIPPQAQHIGMWMTLTADLGQPHGAGLNPARLEPCPAPSELVSVGSR
jgi:hypothetical protein